MKKLLFSFEGRIGRKTWWLGTLGIIAALIVAQALAFGLAMIAEPLALVGLLLVVGISIAGMVGAIALQIKRWHDVDKPGWWLLIGFVPVVGLYALYMNGFVKGTEGRNQFGADPITETESGYAQTA